VPRPDDPRLAADDELELTLQAHAHLLVHMLVQRNGGSYVLEVEEGEHDPLAPDCAHGDPWKQLLRRCRDDIEEWHGARTFPGQVPVCQATIPPPGRVADPLLRSSSAFLQRWKACRSAEAFRMSGLRKRGGSLHHAECFRTPASLPSLEESDGPVSASALLKR